MPLKEGEDVRYCWNRHHACRTELSSHDKKDDLPPNRLKVDVLTVCRQVYVETNPILWSTNTWSFHYKDAWRCWLRKMNANQKRLVKKVHLSRGVVFDFMTKSTISALKDLEELNVDIFTWNGPDFRNSEFEHYFPKPHTATVLITLVKQFFRAERITVIVVDGWQRPSNMSERVPFEERVTIAEACRSHLITIQTKVAPMKKEKHMKLPIGENRTEVDLGSEEDVVAQK
jgi:hypothetical protein